MGIYQIGIRYFCPKFIGIFLVFYRYFEKALVKIWLNIVFFGRIKIDLVFGFCSCHFIGIGLVSVWNFSENGTSTRDSLHQAPGAPGIAKKYSNSQTISVLEFYSRNHSEFCQKVNLGANWPKTFAVDAPLNPNKQTNKHIFIIFVTDFIFIYDTMIFLLQNFALFLILRKRPSSCPLDLKWRMGLSGGMWHRERTVVEYN